MAFVFYPKKRKEIDLKCDSASPVKITNCRIKRNAFTPEDEVRINKHSKIMDPGPKELDFDICSVNDESEHTNEQPISVIQKRPTKR